MEKKTFEVKVEDNKIILEGDSNKDGQPSMRMQVYMDESLQEIIKRGEAVEGEAMVKFKFGLDGLSLALDTDKDGEPSLDLFVDLAEGLDEAGVKLES